MIPEMNRQPWMAFTVPSIELDLVMENASDDVSLLAGEDYGYDGELEEI